MSAGPVPANVWNLGKDRFFVKNISNRLRLSLRDSRFVTAATAQSVMTAERKSSPSRGDSILPFDAWFNTVDFG